MKKRSVRLAMISAVVLATSLHASNGAAQVRYLQGCRGEQNQVAVALLSLRNSIASGDIADLGDRISTQYIEAGVVCDSSRWMELSAVLLNRLGIGKTSGDSLGIGEVSGTGMKMAPLWDLDLSSVEIRVNEGARKASVICKGVFYGARGNTVMAASLGSNDVRRELELEFEMAGGSWKLAGSSGLIRFMEETIALMNDGGEVSADAK